MDRHGMPELLTPEEVAEVFSVPKTTVYHWARHGTLRCLRIGRHVRFRENDIRDYIQNH
jgi:DNA binding domain, excisionase family